MFIQRAYAKCNHPYGFGYSRGLSKITGIFHIIPEGLERRACYRLEYEDGNIDYTPVSEFEAGNYIIVDKGGQ